jgi:hypothetical protein
VGFGQPIRFLGALAILADPVVQKAVFVSNLGEKKTYHTPIGPQKSWLRIKSQSLNPKVGEISQNAYHLPTGHPENCGFALLVNSPSHLIIAKPNVRRMEKRAGTTLKSYTRCI